MAKTGRARRRRAARQQQHGSSGMTRWFIAGGAAFALLLVVGAIVMFGGQRGATAEIRAVGTDAPTFSGTAGNGEDVSLSQLRSENESVVLVFYRGHF